MKDTANIQNNGKTNHKLTQDLAFGVITSLLSKRWTESHVKCSKVACKSSEAFREIVTCLYNLNNLKSYSHLCINNLVKTLIYQHSEVWYI